MVVETVDDNEAAVLAMRLGWYFAELRGRTWPEGPRPPAHPCGDLLPLRTERSERDQQREAQAVLEAVAVRLGLDHTHIATISEAAGTSELGAIGSPSGTLEKAYRVADAYFQDTLIARSEVTSCGYQLGRGLAEAYWALDRDGENLGELLGSHRCAELSRLAGRLTSCMDEYSPAALAGSLEAWRTFVEANRPSLGERDDRGDGAVDVRRSLFEQMRRWHEVLIVGQDPTTFIRPYAVRTNLRLLGAALRSFWPQLVWTGLGIALLLALILTVNRVSSSGVWAPILGLASVIGISVGGITGALKNSAQGLLKRLRKDAYTDLVAEAITALPPDPRFSTTEARKAVSRRRFTSGSR
jgi:hypothetical protein